MANSNSGNKRFPSGVYVSFHTSHLCGGEDRTKVEKFDSPEEADKRIEEILREGGKIYCARIWECGIPAYTLYWNGEKIFNRNTLGIISRERARSIIVHENGDWDDPIDEAEAAAELGVSI